MKQHEEEAPHLDNWLRIRIPTELVAIIDKHARSQMTTASAFARAALIAALKAEEVPTPALFSRMKPREPRERELA